MSNRIPCLAAAVILCACADNVGRIYSRPGGGGGSTTTSTVQVVPEGGTTVSGRPKVRKVFPSGSGWPSTVPIVVVFNQSMNEDSVAPSASSGQVPNLLLRLGGTEQALPGTYDFLLGGTVVLFRPTAPLAATPNSSYQIVVRPEVRSVDGIRYGGTETVLAEFTTDQAPEVNDGRILTVLPEDNGVDRPREHDVYVVFTKPAVASSVTATTLQVRPRSGAPIQGTRTTPLNLAGNADPRIVRFRPAAILEGETNYEVVVTDGITFANSGKLDFSGRTPFSRFRTVAQAAPTALTVGNPAAGFPDQVNRSNFEQLQVDATVDASALAGDNLLVRLYGVESRGTNTVELAFLERSIRLANGGAQTVTVDFTGALGPITGPRLREGPITLAASLDRGSRSSGFSLSASANNPRLDVTPPTLTRMGPPNGGVDADLITDQEYLVLHGTASERLASATLTVGSETATLFASASNGRFATTPLLLGRTTGVSTYQLALVDQAGNSSAVAFTGEVRQRGVVTGSVAAGELVVEAYDEATLLPLSGVTVLVEPGLPQSPAVGRLSAVTAANGRALFTGLSAAGHTITLVRPGYHLRSLLDTSAGHVSLPLRPMDNATAILSGSTIFTPSPGVTVLVGSSLFDDPRLQSLQTQGTTPTAIPATAIRPGRLQVLTAFGGAFEPTEVPSFSTFSVHMLGPTGLVPTPPVAPVAGGETSNQTLPLLTATNRTINLAAPYVQDFGLATGLDTGSLAGTPTVRIVGSLRGLPGMALFGAGFATVSAGAAYTIQGTYSLAAATGLVGYVPLLWVSSEARDLQGNISRHRRLVADNAAGTTFPTVAAPGIPTISAPGGPSTGAPAVTFQDRLAATDLVVGGHGMHELSAVDGAGRRWSLLLEDRTGAVGPVTIQIPDLTGAGVGGLSTGNWNVTAESFLYFSLNFTAASYMVEERLHQQVTYARAAPVTFVVQ